MKKNMYVLTLFVAFYTFSYAQITLIPDPIFENRLVVGGIDSDGTVNGQILTTDAIAFSGLLSLSNRGINDLTGIEAFVNITELNVDYNNITSLNLTNNSLLTSVNASGCSLLTSVNVTGLTNLSEMLFASANLNSLDVTTNSGLTNLNIRYNNVSSLDLSQNHILSTINLKSNVLTFLDLRNGNQDNVVYFDSDYNPNLTCILFDDGSVIFRDEVIWFIDNLSLCLVSNEAECTTCLNALSVNDVNKKAYTMYPNPVAGQLQVTTNMTNSVMSILNITGKVLMTKSLNEHDNLIDVSGLSSGLYLARFTSDNRVDTKKLMIK